jgi:hypothetical protein
MPNRSSTYPLLMQCLMLGLLAISSTVQGQSCKPITIPAFLGYANVLNPAFELTCSKQKPSDGCVVAGYTLQSYYVLDGGGVDSLALMAGQTQRGYCRHTHILEGTNSAWVARGNSNWCPREAFLPDGVGDHVCAAAEQQHRLNATLLGAKDQAEARIKVLEAELKTLRLCQSSPKSAGCTAPVQPASPLSKPKQ